jgi:hypothetical protein
VNELDKTLEVSFVRPADAFGTITQFPPGQGFGYVTLDDGRALSFGYERASFTPKVGDRVSVWLWAPEDSALGISSTSDGLIRIEAASQSSLATEIDELDTLRLLDRAFSRGVVEEVLTVCERFRRKDLVEHLRVMCLAAMGRAAEARRAAIAYARVALRIDPGLPRSVFVFDSDVIAALDAIAKPGTDPEIDDWRARVGVGRS